MVLLGIDIASLDIRTEPVSVGNLAFSQWMNAKLLHSVRVTHGRDPVIHLPIILMGYVHIDDEYWMDEVNGVHWKRCKETEGRRDDESS